MRNLLILFLFLGACSNPIPPNSIYEKGDVVYKIDNTQSGTIGGTKDVAREHTYGEIEWIYREKAKKFIYTNKAVDNYREDDDLKESENGFSFEEWTGTKFDIDYRRLGNESKHYYGYFILVDGDYIIKKTSEDKYVAYHIAEKISY